MENSSSQSYTSMMNSTLPPPDPQSPHFLQNTQNQMSQQYPNFHPPHMNYQTPPFNPNFQPHYPHQASSYGAPGSYQPIPPMHPSYHGVPYHGNAGMYPPGAYGAGSSNNPSSPVGCMAFLGAVGGAGSRGDESNSPGVSYTMSPPYPVSPAYPMSQDPASNNEEGSESSPDEIEKKGKSKSWSKHEDELLIAAWLHNSCDSIHGNSKKSENYWKEVAAELNKYAAKGEKKSIMQCKNHWTKTTKKVTNLLFHQIVETLSVWSPYFTQRNDAFGKPGFSPLHKCTAAIRMLAYGTPADLFDENLRMAESTVIECMITFCKGVIANFSPKYLRKPTNEDIERLLAIGNARGFPGMLGSLDCMHWTWRNCPVAHKGMFTRGDHGVATVMLEAVASEDLWIWHAFFGVAGSSNDLNVLDQSTLFTQVVQGTAPEVHFEVNGHEYNLGYYLVDGIYPEWATFVKSIPMPLSDEDKLFKAHQEGARKDVERAFGVLQARFAIVRQPGRMHRRDVLAEIMYACIILHNMIVEDERHTYKCYDKYDCDYEEADFTVPYIVAEQGPIDEFDLVLEKETAIRHRATHRRLKADLVQNIWEKFGGN